MKNTICWLFLAVFLASCASKNNINQSISGCLDDGKCSITVSPNQQISTEKTNRNELTINPENSSEKSIYTFEYNREVDPKYVDGHYKEQLIFELPQNLEKLELSNHELKEIKLIFGRFCYCKGFTGYYWVTNGTFKLDGNKITIAFKIQEVPQELTNISFNIK